MRKNTKKTQVELVLKKLHKQYPNASIALNFSTDMQLLVATMLSAQCTDVRVNIVTKNLFLKYKTITDYAMADIRVLEDVIRPVGFFHNKAKNIIKAAKSIQEDYKGYVPRRMQELILLPGVGRKTANVILYNAFGKNEGIAVDTHVLRLSKRIGLTLSSSPDKIEKDLMIVIPKKEWGQTNHILIAHGRAICTARKPKCKECIINSGCLYQEKNF